MKTQHTPEPLESGPLFIHEIDSGSIQPEFSIGAQDYRALDGGHIALATGISDRRVAVLFASAPDLLAALAMFEQGPPDGDNTDSWFAQYFINLERARAVIAKAGGTS